MDLSQYLPRYEVNKEMENGANNKSTTKLPDGPVTGKCSPDGNIGDDIKKKQRETLWH